MKRGTQNEIYAMEKNQKSIDTEEAESKEEAPTILEQTKTVLEELKAANAEKKALLDREEKIAATAMLSGRADAGKPLKKEETPKEYKNRIMRGGK